MNISEKLGLALAILPNLFTFILCSGREARLLRYPTKSTMPSSFYPNYNLGARNYGGRGMWQAPQSRLIPQSGYGSDSWNHLPTVRYGHYNNLNSQSRALNTSPVPAKKEDLEKDVPSWSGIAARAFAATFLPDDQCSVDEKPHPFPTAWNLVLNLLDKNNPLLSSSLEVYEKMSQFIDVQSQIAKRNRQDMKNSVKGEMAEMGRLLDAVTDPFMLATHYAQSGNKACQNFKLCDAVRKIRTMPSLVRSVGTLFGYLASNYFDTNSNDESTRAINTVRCCLEGGIESSDRCSQHLKTLCESSSNQKLPLVKEERSVKEAIYLF